MKSILVFLTTAWCIAAGAENVDCVIDDTHEGLKNVVRKVYASQGVFTELYSSRRVTYRLVEWQPNIKRPPTLLVKIETPAQTFVSTGSIRQYVSLLVVDEATNHTRSISCRPPNLH